MLIRVYEKYRVNNTVFPCAAEIFVRDFVQIFVPVTVHVSLGSILFPFCAKKEQEIFVKWPLLPTNQFVMLNTSVKAIFASSSESSMYVHLYVRRKTERSLESLRFYYIAGFGISSLTMEPFM